ncbi:MAG: helix-turn-helix transcriptional regulator [Eubacterium sp.]|nr:helix-turn-helix transcriptional regulator [Eubacterium sp.]
MDNNTTGAFIAQLRKENNLTQKQLAEKLNVTDKAISRWETGKGYPEVSMLIPLCELLGVSVNELLTGERIEKDKIIDNSNRVIVDTMIKSNSAINTLYYVMLAVFVIVQLAVFYGVPFTAGQGDEMGIIFFYVLATFINSISMGFIKGKRKFFIPVAAGLMFVPMGFADYANFARFDGEELALYIIVFFVVSFLGLLFGVLIKLFINLIRKLIEKTKD